MSSELLFHEKIVEEDGGIVEMKIWGVPESARNPSGIKYSLYWTREGKVLIGYDNHHPKGHHRHYGDLEEAYAFTTVQNLINDFQEDRRRMKR